MSDTAFWSMIVKNSQSIVVLYYNRIRHIFATQLCVCTGNNRFMSDIDNLNLSSFLLYVYSNKILHTYLSKQ